LNPVKEIPQLPFEKGSWGISESEAFHVKIILLGDLKNPCNPLCPKKSLGDQFLDQ
jgi:hypothetical protein